MSTVTAQTKPLDLDAANKQLAGADAQQIIRWAAGQFGDGLVMTSSFGAQSAVMLHLATRVVPNIPIIFLDTGFLFPETYQFAQQLADMLKLNLKVYPATLSAARMQALHGPLWENDEALYSQYTKVEPQQRACRELGATAWLSGVRAEQTEHRKSLRTVEGHDKRYSVYPVHPILNWTRKQVGEYLRDHKLPYHPLVEKGYMSIGDTHSTQPVGEGQNEREGRFGGLKQECGLHLPATPSENESREGSGL